MQVMGRTDGTRRPELLAPAGNMEALEAAVKAGADAVYAGGSLFSARAFAGNFDTEELKRALDYCHLYDVKLYLALNTLLKENEIDQVAGFLAPIYAQGLDGIIVQDIGVASIVRRDFPGLALHASTQMSISSHYGAALMKELGFRRIVPARELSLDEIISIKQKVDIEIESFVHGAMCFCYSGRCLFSSFLGGRSGNRGRCAQPCRQNFAHGDQKSYLMSMKDMCALDILNLLTEGGIDSFKIEGRMKKPEYVASAVAAYRKAIDRYFDINNTDAVAISEDDLRDIYNRGGFSNGYYLQQRGENMIAADRPNHTGLLIGKVEKIQPPYIYVRLCKDIHPQDVLELRSRSASLLELQSGAGGYAGEAVKLKGRNFNLLRKGLDVYRTRNNHLLNEISKNILEKEKTIPAQAMIRARAGKPLEVTVTDMKFPEIAVSLYGSVVEKAASHPTNPDNVIEKMHKTGGSGVRLKVTCDMDKDIFIPMSQLNDLRRQAIERFKEALSARYHRI